MNIRFLPAEATMSAPGLRLFLSTVTSEFGPHRLAMKSVLVGPKIEVKEQGDFINCGVDTLAMLNEYISECTGVIHLLGEATGAYPAVENVRSLLQKYADFA